MKYKVLYRKYRPDNFDSIVGQEYITKILKNSIINNQVSHAYIFSGPRGTGKTTTAKVLAKALNCANPENGSPCGKCEFCKNFKENPDIIEIDAASNRGVNEIRQIIDNIKLTPTNGKYKVYIIDEVHMLTMEAFNALLLTLEEPPTHTVFILATTNVENVPITILSRCQRFDFQKIKVEKIVELLTNVCEKENIKITEEALNEIAIVSEGGLRDALSLLDQLSKNECEITLELIENQIKVVSQKTINALLDTIEQNNFDEFFNIINDFRSRGVDYKTLVKRIVELISKKAKNIMLHGSRERLNFDSYKNMIFELSDSLNKININVDNYTILEMLLLNYFSTNNNKVKNNVVEEKIQVSKIENESKIIEDKPIANNDENVIESFEIDENLINIRINNCFYDAKRTYLEDAKNEYQKLLNDSNLEGKLKNILIDSEIVAASSKNLICTCLNNHLVNLANGMLEEIEKLFSKICHKDYKIIFLTKDRWNKEKEQYILDLKAKKVYKYIEEEKQKEIDNSSEINDVFDISKVEIV